MAHFEAGAAAANGEQMQQELPPLVMQLIVDRQLVKVCLLEQNRIFRRIKSVENLVPALFFLSFLFFFFQEPGWSTGPLMAQAAHAAIAVRTVFRSFPAASYP